MKYKWIPVDQHLPECEKEVLIQTDKGTITTAIYEDGKMSENDSTWNWTDIDYDYDEENDIKYIPEGWWEYRHFNIDEVYNNAVDEVVVAWMPMPEPYRWKAKQYKVDKDKLEEIINKYKRSEKGNE